MCVCVSVDIYLSFTFDVCVLKREICRDIIFTLSKTPLWPLQHHRQVVGCKQTGSEVLAGMIDLQCSTQPTVKPVKL